MVLSYFPGGGAPRSVSSSWHRGQPSTCDGFAGSQTPQARQSQPIAFPPTSVERNSRFPNSPNRHLCERENPQSTRYDPRAVHCATFVQNSPYLTTSYIWEFKLPFASNRRGFFIAFYLKQFSAKNPSILAAVSQSSFPPISAIPE